MTTSPVALVLGAGPGLGISVAHRFGRGGYRVALVSRTETRHAGYLDGLAATGIPASAFAADVRDREQLLSTVEKIRAEFGRIDMVYYGPADVTTAVQPITEATAEDVAGTMSWVYPAVHVVGATLPGMLERGAGGFLFSGGLSAVRPMPQLGALALSCAALRNYAVTLHAALAGRGVYSGILNIGGLIDRGDIHRMVSSRPEQYGDIASATLDPDELADAAWRLFTTSEHAEETFSVLD